MSTLREREQGLLDRFPEIEWLAPIEISSPRGSWLACRLCIAIDGLREQDLPERGFQQREHFERHLRDRHRDAS